MLLPNMISLYREGAITGDDLEGFSDKLLRRVRDANANDGE